MTEPVVHIIDDDPSLRAALQALLESVGLQSRAYPATEHFLEQRDGAFHGCLLLDVRLPGTNGLVFQERLLELDIRLPVIVMTGHGDIPMSVRAMKAGAIDFLSKPFREQDLLDGIQAALERDRARLFGEEADAAIRRKYQSLSPREREVMYYVTAGKMNKQVAAELGLSEVTIKIHRRAAMQKMGAASLADLVRMAQLLDQHHRLDSGR